MRPRFRLAVEELSANPKLFGRAARILVVSAALAATLVACAGEGAPGAGESPASVDGLWRVTIAVLPRSYSGTVTIAASGDVPTGVLAIVAPSTVDGNLRVSESDGTLTLTGPYTSGNGCTGTITIAVRGKGNRRSGPTEIVDSCAGTIEASATLSR